MTTFSTGVVCNASSDTRPKSFYQMIQAENATNNLKFCLDVGDSACYSGTGQVINDISGNGINFYRGINNNVNTYSPTFHGTAGNRSSNEYLSFNGTNRMVSTGTNSIMGKMIGLNTSHTLGFVSFIPNSGNSNYVVLQRNGDPFRTYNFYGPDYGGSASDGLFYFKDSINGGAPGLIPYGVWSLIFHRMNYTTAINGSFANGSWKVFVNGSFYTGTSPYLDYYANDNTPVATNMFTFVPNGTLLSCIALWDRGLTDTEMTAIYNRMKLRFPSLP